MENKKSVFEAVSEIRELIKPLGCEITAFDSGRELFTEEGKSEINVRISLPTEKFTWVRLSGSDENPAKVQ
jgi:hypothetical protein